MPGSTPATSQLDWLISTTAMIVLSWSNATRDLMKASPGAGGGRSAGASGHSVSYLPATMVPSPSPPAPYHLSAGGRRIRTAGPLAETSGALPRNGKCRRGEKSRLESGGPRFESRSLLFPSTTSAASCKPEQVPMVQADSTNSLGGGNILSPGHQLAGALGRLRGCALVRRDTQPRRSSA